MNDRTLKIVDVVERTHYLPCTRVVFLGWGDTGKALAFAAMGHDEANDLDVGVQQFLTAENYPHKRYFLRFQSESDPYVVASSCFEAYLLGPTGSTLENFMKLRQPARSDAVTLPI